MGNEKCEPAVTPVTAETNLEKIVEEQNKTIMQLKEDNKSLRNLVTTYREALSELVEDMKDINRYTQRSLNKTQLIISKGDK